MRIRSSIKIALGMALLIVGASGQSCPNLTPGGFPHSTAWDETVIATVARPTVVATADFDADGKLDIVAGFAGSDTLTAAVIIYFQEDTTHFTAVQVASGANVAGVTSLSVGDIGADGKQDIIAGCNSGVVYLKSPDDPRQSAGWSSFILDQSFGDGFAQWTDVAIAQLDNANGPDIVACNSNLGRVSWFRSPSSTAANGVGWIRYDIDATTRTGAVAVVVADIDGDGRLDVVSTAPGESTARIAWYTAPVDPTAVPWTKVTIGNVANASRLALGDLNADGRTDVAVTDPADHQIGWYLQPNPPTGTWVGHVLAQYASNTPTDVKVIDVDANGQLDVVVPTQSVGTLRWFTRGSDVNAKWIENNLRDLSIGAVRIAMGDIDGDGKPDVIAAAQSTTSDTSVDAIIWCKNPE